MQARTLALISPTITRSARSAGGASGGRDCNCNWCHVSELPLLYS